MKNYQTKQKKEKPLAGGLTTPLFYFLFFFSISPFMVEGQIDVERYLVKETITCPEIAMASTSLIPVLHQDNQIDTLHALLYYWDEQCGLAEPLLRIYLIHQIETNTLSDEFYPDEIFNYLNQYEEISGFEDPNYYLDYYTWEYYPIDTAYNTFTKNLASHLQRYTDLRPIESFFLDFYSNNFSQAIERLKNGELEGTRLDSIYQAQQFALKRAKKPYMNFYLGLWSPRSELKLLGIHPQVGFGGGFIQQRFMLEFIMKFGFLPSQNYYEVVVDNLGYQTKHFMNLHVSGRVGFALLDYNRHQLIVSVGLGYEGIEAFTTAEQEESGLSRMISSLSFSPGAELRIPVGANSYVGLNVRYNFLNFQTRRNETPLSGDALMIGLSAGFDLE